MLFVVKCNLVRKICTARSDIAAFVYKYDVVSMMMHTIRVAMEMLLWWTEILVTGPTWLEWMNDVKKTGKYTKDMNFHSILRLKCKA